MHNQNEDKYHPSHYKKEYYCEFEEKYGKCKFYKTCYGIHRNEYNENSEEKTDENKIEDDEDIKKIKKSVDICVKIGKNCFCRNCYSLNKKGELCFFVKCKHFLCIKCFQKLNKSNRKNKNLNCIFCGEKIKKGKVVFVKFDKK